MRRLIAAGLFAATVACGSPAEKTSADAIPAPVAPTPLPVVAPTAVPTLPPERAPAAPAAAKPAAVSTQTDPVDMLELSPHATYPGKYTYAVSGSYSGVTGNGRLPEETIFGAYNPRKNVSQRVVFWNDMGRMFDATVKLDAAGRTLSALKVTAAGFAAEFAGGGVLLPADLAPGKEWSWQATSTDGKKRFALKCAVKGTEAVSVAGATVQASILDVLVTITDSSTAPAQVMTSQGTERWRAAYPLLLEAQYVTELKAGLVSTYKSEATRKLKSLRAG